MFRGTEGPLGRSKRKSKRICDNASHPMPISNFKNHIAIQVAPELGIVPSLSDRSRIDHEDGT